MLKFYSGTTRCATVRYQVTVKMLKTYTYTERWEGEIKRERESERGRERERERWRERERERGGERERERVRERERERERLRPGSAAETGHCKAGLAEFAFRIIAKSLAVLMEQFGVLCMCGNLL